NGASTCAPGETVQACPLKKPHLVELVEVVARSPLRSVVGAGAKSAKLAESTARKDKSKGGAYKQYINLGKDIDGAAQRHPEYGRPVELRARVEGEGSLAGLTVEFRHVLTPGKDRPAGMTGVVKEGFSAAGGVATTTATTDADGWTGTIEFHLSQYAGDRFEVFAKLSDGAGGEKSIGKFEVWRKFWYQVTRAHTHVVPAPAKSVAAYEAVCADMLAADEVTFTKATAPAGAFYPGWMMTVGGADADESVIGGHNRLKFYEKFKPEPGKPVKGHLIVCRHQWDPAAAVSGLASVLVRTSPSQEIPVKLGSWNSGIVKPALEGNLVAFGKWSKGAAHGALTDADIVVEKGRSGLDIVKVRLPAGAPDPTKGAVRVQLKLNYGKYWGGESNDHQMLIVYDGDAKAFNQAVSHEFGHGFSLTPSAGKQTAPLTKHTTYYYNDQGGQGPHCHTGATLVVDKDMTSGKRWDNGSCIMYHQLNPPTCTQLFCASCEPHLKLKDMQILKTAR
ncbi:MAG: hypothetical protein ABI696_09355, partial [Rubrivivax sp.]